MSGRAASEGGVLLSLSNFRYNWVLYLRER